MIVTAFSRIARLGSVGPPSSVTGPMLAIDTDEVVRT